MSKNLHRIAQQLLVVAGEEEETLVKGVRLRLKDAFGVIDDCIRVLQKKYEPTLGPDVGKVAPLLNHAKWKLQDVIQELNTLNR